MLKPLKIWVQNILPIVYDDSLSYYEVVAKVSEKTNEIVTQTNENTHAIEALSELFTELGDIDDLKELLDELKVIIDDLYTTDLPIMDGTANAGSANHAARSDHVHPRDTTRAPNNHASNATTYGEGTENLYGHVKLSDDVEFNGNAAISTKGARRIRAKIANDNLFENWCFVGGGSQLGDGMFPINQRGATVTPGYNVYPVDRWRMTGYASTQCELLATGLKLTNNSSSGQAGLQQNFPSIIPAGTKLTVSIWGTGGETFTAMAVRFYDSSNSYDSIPTSQMVRDGELFYGSITLTRDCVSAQLRIFPAVTDFTFKAVKLEIGSYQTLAHNEGTEADPNWVLNELPDWFEELRKCQRYLQWIPTPIGTIFGPVACGICWNDTTVRIALSLPVPMIRTPTATLENATAKLYIEGISGAVDASAITVRTSSYNNANLRNILCLECTITGGTTAAQAILGLIGTGNPGGILLSCEN